MTRSGEKSNAHWEDSLWRSGDLARAALGGPAQQRVLAAWWRAAFSLDPIEPDARILDVASGALPVFFHARDLAKGATLTALDYAPSALLAVRAADPSVLTVVGDVGAPPFVQAAFRFVCSQFGLEYAGLGAFRATAALVAPKGRFAAVIHYRGGAIDAECAADEGALKGFSKSGLIGAARRAFDASFAAPRGHQYKDKKAERALSDSLAAARRTPQSPAPTGARALVERYAADIERLAERRFAYAPDDAYAWLDRMERDLALYRKRMAAMRAAALDEAGMRAASEKLQAEGLVDIAAAPLVFAPGAKPGAWTLNARKP